MLRYLNELAWPDVAALNPATTYYLLPISALEQHGRHLPLGTDDYILHSALQCLQRDTNAESTILALPAVHYGNSHEHIQFAGTVSFSCATIVAIVEDVLASMRRGGFDKLILLNAHGGNTALLDAYAQEWEAKFGARVYNMSLWASPFFSDAQSLIETPLQHEVHAGEIETSLLLQACPQFVKRDEMGPNADCPLTLKPFYSGWSSASLSPGNGAIGVPSKATAEKGATLHEYIAKRVLAMLDEIRQMR